MQHNKIMATTISPKWQKMVPLVAGYIKKSSIGKNIYHEKNEPLDQQHNFGHNTKPTTDTHKIINKLPSMSHCKL